MAEQLLEIFLRACMVRITFWGEILNFCNDMKPVSHILIMLLNLFAMRTVKSLVLWSNLELNIIFSSLTEREQ